jgi:hypothetical protein
MCAWLVGARLKKKNCELINAKVSRGLFYFVLQIVIKAAYYLNPFISANHGTSMIHFRTLRPRTFLSLTIGPRTILLLDFLRYFTLYLPVCYIPKRAGVTVTPLP